MVGAGFWILKTYNLKVTGFCNSLLFHLDQYLGSSYEGWMPSDDVWNRSRLGGQLQVFWSEFVRIILRLNNNRCPWIVERVEGPSNSLTIILWVAFIIKDIPMSDYKLKKWKILNIGFKGRKSMAWDGQSDWESKTVTQKKVSAAMRHHR